MSNILVTGIGGNVGQGVLRNIRSFFPKVRIVGTDVSELTVGARYCDTFYTVPYATDKDYGTILRRIAEKEDVSLIIPTTDYESYYLGLLKDLPFVLASSPEVTKICLDKYETYLFFKDTNFPFVKTILPSDYSGDIDKIIVKPREGRGSRNIHFNPKSLDQFDDSFIIQPQLFGKEITTAFYVDKDNRLHGEITFERTLEHGATNRAEVVLNYKDEISDMLNRFIKLIKITGPCNLQSIVTENGIVPFEINCRYSGTNSIRAQFGFEDVRYGLEEYLLGVSLSPVKIVPGFALRIYLDAIYRNTDITKFEPGSNNSYIF